MSMNPRSRKTFSARLTLEREHSQTDAIVWSFMLQAHLFPAQYIR